MHLYRVEVTYDMGMSTGRGIHEFVAEDDEAAAAYIKKHEGWDLGPILRDASFDSDTLSREVQVDLCD